MYMYMYMYVYMYMVMYMYMYMYIVMYVYMCIYVYVYTYAYIWDFIARYCSKSMTKAKREFGYSAGDAAPWAIRVLTGKFGKTPRDYANSQGHTELAARLLKAAGGGTKS